ncbi:DsrE family protein [Haloarcula nitratireducens]|uniref:DsrE family protein n=1 Tax=Haloarcula nitratireducens TaxID=2487749 RepID=A0AAW4PAE8_9EURY|nr:DsrE family protein [Halomicroarcula nitratireducens]MBX0294727.1 DsrE family protein [Halomicroarcula nitratireducens]
MADEHPRRTVLRWAGGLTAVGVAGCSGDGDAGSGTSADSTDTETATAEPTETETETTTPQPTMSTVFHFASDTDKQKHALNNVANLLADDSTEVENVVLVANGAGIKLLAESTSEQPDRVRSLVEDGVSFRACENSMDAFSITESELIDGVETVPAGVGELTKLQARENYAYIETP